MSELRAQGLSSDEDDEDSLQGKFLTFKIGEETYGIEIRHVTEIIGVQKITPVPDVPEFVRGMINLRGRVIPIMDVRLRFRKAPRAYDDRTCIIVIHIKDAAVGLVVDTVSEVLSIPDSAIDAPPRMGGPFQRVMLGLGKVGDEVKILLDATKLLFDEAEAKALIGKAQDASRPRP
jgi:purine-binding chemotaxis protein CheW